MVLCADDNHGWAIAVGVILGVLLLAIIAVAAILLRRKRQREEVRSLLALQHMVCLP